MNKDGRTGVVDRDGPRRPSRRWSQHGGHDLLGPHAIARRPSRGTLAVSQGDPSEAGRAVVLDGARGEGGGQILRTALSLSLLTGRPFRIDNIRARRDRPGLRPQHLAAVQAAAALGRATTEGAAVGSKSLRFEPSSYQPADLALDIGTAGATALVLHTLHLPIALRADRPVRLSLTGGTFNAKAPSFPFLARTWRRHQAAMGLPVALAMPAAGFYPKGGGRLEAWIEPAAAPKARVLTDRGPLRRIVAEAGTCRLEGRDVAARLLAQVETRLEGHGPAVESQEATWPGPGPGVALSLVAEFEHDTVTVVALGERGKPAEAVADEAADDLIAAIEAGGAVDEHSADQLLLPMALAEGRSIFTVGRATDHLRTNAETIVAFLDRPIRLEEPDDGPVWVIVG